MFSQTSASIYIIVINVIHCTCACPNLLDQWQQMSLSERAERAYIVLAGRVISRIPSAKPSESTSYSIHFEIQDILKGADLLPSGIIPKTLNPDEGVMVRIEGYGSIILCLSDVQEGASYILFVKLKSDGYSLRAHYISAMGAAAEWTLESHKMVASTLGWRPWSSWSFCSTSCGNGQQSRSRYCHYSPCYHGVTVNIRHCNLIQCAGSVDLRQRFQNISTSGRRENTPVVTTPILSLLYRKSVTNQGFPLPDGRLSFEHKNDHQQGSPLTFIFGQKSITITIFNISFTLNNTLNEDDHVPETYAFTLNNSHLSVWSDHCLIRRFQMDPDKWSQSGYPMKLSSQQIYVNSYLIKSTSLLTLSANEINHTNGNSCNKIHASDALTLPTAMTTASSAHQESSGTYRWSEWSLCSVTCGRGWRRRRLQCVEGSADCLQGLKQNDQSRPLFRAEECNMPHCPNLCSIKCLNGGLCISNRCVCVNGYRGPTCNEPICQKPCQNGGLCVKPNICICPEGYSQPDCLKPICKKQCENGGQCVAPDLCACPVGYRGKRCQRAICIPNCRNGGFCVYPNLCSCNPGTSGKYCEKYECFPQCMNGGKCIRQGKCSCKVGFHGKYCQNVRCLNCLNGGRCTRSSVCSCPEGFYGSRCEHKGCVMQLRYQKVIKPVVRRMHPFQNPFCNSARNLCRPLVSRFVVVHKIVFKPYFSCT